MPHLDDELVARAVRWCADAGRQATSEQVRAALSRLSWDELLAARALLADPPPAHPLGPMALADMARGALADVAAEREREGQYRPEEPAPSPGPPGGREPSPEGPSAIRHGRRRAGSRGPRAAAPLIRRARDRVDPSPPSPPRLPLVDELSASEGRAVLERLVRELGARRSALVKALNAGWRRADGGRIGEDDLALLLDAHGMERAFARRERDALLHDLRAAGGAAGPAAGRAGLSRDAFWDALRRLGATAAAEAIRDVHRQEVLRRTTLAERTYLVLADPDRLADLGVLDELLSDLRRRLPDHVRALRGAGASQLGPVLARSLGVDLRELPALLARLGLDVQLEDLRARAPAGTGVGAPARRRPRPRDERPRPPGGRGGGPRRRGPGRR